MPIFDHDHLKITEATFSFPEFPTALKKLVYSISYILEIKSILESCEQTGHTQF